VGKSVLATDLALAVATGAPWFGRKVGKGAVLYFALERLSVTERRFAVLQRDLNLEAVPIALSNSGLDLASNGVDADKIIAAAKTLTTEIGHPLRLIVLDTLSRAIAGQDENSASAISRVAANLSKIAWETGATVLVLHHSAKATGELRGSSALLGAIDCAIRLRRLRQYHVAAIEKSNDTAEGVEFVFSLKAVEIAFDRDTGEPETTVVVVPMEASGISNSSHRISARAENMLGVIQEMATAEGANRRDVLAAGRDRGHFSRNKNSSSEQLRQALRELSGAKLITYNEERIWLSSRLAATGPTPTTPPPCKGAG
jgi:hypothetical protein